MDKYRLYPKKPIGQTQINSAETIRIHAYHRLEILYESRNDIQLRVVNNISNSVVWFSENRHFRLTPKDFERLINNNRYIVKKSESCES